MWLVISSLGRGVVIERGLNCQIDTVSVYECYFLKHSCQRAGILDLCKGKEASWGVKKGKRELCTNFLGSLVCWIEAIASENWIF